VVAKLEALKSSLLNKNCTNHEILANCFNSLFIFGLKYVKKCTLVFQLEEVCGINIVVHKMKNVSGGIEVTCV